MITDRQIDQAFSDLKATCGGVKEDYFGLLYLEREHDVPRARAVNQIAFGGNDYGFDGFHFDKERRNLYLFQFKYSTSHAQFKGSFQRIIADGMRQVFAEPNKDDAKNQLLVQLRSCIVDNRVLIDQVCILFVFLGDPEEAERSLVLDRLRENLEDRRYLVDECLGHECRLVIEFRSVGGKVGSGGTDKKRKVFPVSAENVLEAKGPNGETMHVGLVPLTDLRQMHKELGPRFFDANIRYGLGEGEAVNRAISKAFRQIVIDQKISADVFAFNHNGITLAAERFEHTDGHATVTSPRLLNGAQTLTTLGEFLEEHKGDNRLEAGHERLNAIRVMCRVISGATPEFVTTVTVNNNRQNPVEPWNLRANDLIQLELHQKLKDDLGIYYERQENAFDQLSADDLDEYGIKEDSKAVALLKLTQVFLLTDGLVSRVSEMRRVFEDDKTYSSVFKPSRLEADSRHILLCYKVQFRLRKLVREIEEKGQNKYWFVSRARNLVWALTCQALLNHPDLERLADDHGTSLSLPADFTALLNQLATTRVRVLLSELLEDKDYAEKVEQQNLSFLRTDRAFEKAMILAHKRWRWTHRKL